jgi:hypothetical protein
MSRKSHQKRQRLMRLRKLNRGCKPDGTPADAVLSPSEVCVGSGAVVEVENISSDVQNAIEKKLRDRGVIDP